MAGTTLVLDGTSILDVAGPFTAEYRWKTSLLGKLLSGADQARSTEHLRAAMKIVANLRDTEGMHLDRLHGHIARELKDTESRSGPEIR